MAGPIQPLKALTIAVRRALTDPEAHRKPLAENFGQLYHDHAVALIELGPAVRDLIRHRLDRDRALAAGRFAQAQRHGRRLAEAENVITGLLDLLAEDPAPPAPIRAASRAEVKERCRQRQAKVAALLGQGRTLVQIAQLIGCHVSTVSNDASAIRKAQARRPRVRPLHVSPPC